MLLVIHVTADCNITCLHRSSHIYGSTFLLNF